jgi:16S rRNA (guanine966-N2)-methyltransferase
MKILTGVLRGQSILFKPNPHLRPTSDKARKAIFDMLQGDLKGRVVLDLFSGTGALGFEAVSQGALRVIFVEQDKAQCHKIEENLKKWKFRSETQVCHDEVLDWLRFSGADHGPFDLIFLDPPYASGVGQAVLEQIRQKQLLKKGAFVFLECRKREDLPEEFGPLKQIRDKRYGQTKVLVYRMGEI